MTTRMSSHSVVGVLILILNISIAAATAVFAAEATNEQKSTVEKELDVASLTKAIYNNFLHGLRFNKPFNDALVANIPVLPAEGTSPIWLNLTLKGSEGKTTTVKIRVENLYVVGYLMQGATKWLELGKNNDKHLIPNSEFLGFDGSYRDMTGAAGKEVTEISLTQLNFNKAVKDLAESTINATRAQALILVAQMISEASRFTVVSNYIASNITKDFAYLQKWMLPEVEQNWSKLSKIWQCSYRYGDRYKFPNDVKINGTRITKVEELKPYLGILHNENVDQKPENCGIKPNIIDFQALLQDVEPVELRQILLNSLGLILILVIFARR